MKHHKHGKGQPHARKGSTNPSKNAPSGGQKIDQKKKQQGTISIVPKGVGYIPLPGFEQDIEVAPHLLNTALHGDTVEFALLPPIRNMRQQGAVLRVLERSKSMYAGVIKRDAGAFVLKPDHRRMYRDIEIPSLQGAKVSSPLTPKEGMKAVVRFTKWTDPHKRPEGELVEILGPAGSHEAEMRAIVAERGFDTGFSHEVEEAAEQLRARKHEILAEEATKRRDFRPTVTFTIDPDDAKDFDDAISIKKLPDGKIELGVHIADVSAFVTTGDVVDKEAIKRGTSIYLVDRTIPMLPEALSNDLCSLTPGEEKLAFSAVFVFDETGKEYERWFGRTIIKSDKRFTYEEAQRVLDGGDSPFKEEVLTAGKISKALRVERFKKGAIAFETDEVKFKLDKDGKPVSVYVKQRHESNLLIEDLMLHANKAVAEFVTTKCKETAGGKCVFVYRIHDVPKPERIIDLSIFLKAIGHELRGGETGIVHAKDINALFKQIQGTPEQNLIETATVRSMAKAVYSLKNIGHFGLSFQHYTHFTSPIRRYPDLMVHRMLQAQLEGSPISSSQYGLYEKLATQCSEREVSAVEAERDSIKYKQVEFMMGKEGQVFDGTVSGVTEWGMYVEEKNSKAEGMVRLRALADDWYTLDAKHYRLVGEKSKKAFSLGDAVKIRLVAANLDQKTIDWELA